MKVQELVENFDNMLDLKKELQIKKYIPIIEKRKFAVGVIAACTDEDDGFMQADRFKMNIYFHMNMLSLYTNVEQIVEFDDMVEQYDALCECGLMNALIDIIGNDYDELQNVLECELDSLLGQNSIDFQVVKIANKIGSIIDMLGEKLEGYDLDGILPEGTNVAELTNMFNVLK